MSSVLPSLIGFDLASLTDLLRERGEPAYRARQLYAWLYKRGVESFDEMTDFSKALRAWLTSSYSTALLPVDQHARSADGTEKWLFRLPDGHPVETVLIPDGDRQTVCVSSQAGCALACRFCATGTMGLLRNLTVGEILAQLVHIRRLYGPDAFTNIVFMGMGEPLHNFDNLVASLRIITDPEAMAIGKRRVTVSTSGVTPKIRKLADSGVNVRFALSLHAATQEKRETIMPIARTFGLPNLMEAVHYYARTSGDRVLLEYIVFDGFNDTASDADALVGLIHGLPCKINLLPYNPVPGLDFKRPSDDRVDWFARQLAPRTPAVTVRRSRGRDIDAACGQLAARDLAPNRSRLSV